MQEFISFNYDFFFVFGNACDVYLVETYKGLVHKYLNFEVIKYVNKLICIV